METRRTSAKKVKTNDFKSMETDDASKCFSSNNKKLIRFFTGKYEGKFGHVDPTRSLTAGKVPVLVTLKNGLVKKTSVSIWSIANPHPDKAKSFAEAAVMQKPNFEKELKLFAKKVVKMGFMKNDDRYNSLLDLLYDEIESANEKNKNSGKEVIFNEKMV